MKRIGCAEIVRDKAFAIVLEAIPDTVAEAVTSQLKIPTIGIGAGSHCDGQVLVSYDVLGLFDTFAPPFAKQYAQLGQVIVRAAKDYANDVREGLFPKMSRICQQIGCGISGIVESASR